MKQDVNVGSCSTATNQANEDIRRIGLNPNFWYPLALAKDLLKGQAKPVAFAGEPIVLVRTKNDSLYALEDRCAHRQMPLSRGSVVGESICCCYHGWTYHPDGTCRVPYLPGGTAPPREASKRILRVKLTASYLFFPEIQITQTEFLCLTFQSAVRASS
jgi:renierapurpurin 18,18'-hydroxylase